MLVRSYRQERPDTILILHELCHNAPLQEFAASVELLRTIDLMYRAPARLSQGCLRPRRTHKLLSILGKMDPIWGPTWRPRLGAIERTKNPRGPDTMWEIVWLNSPQPSTCSLSRADFLLDFFPHFYRIYPYFLYQHLPSSERHPMPSPTGMQIYDTQGHRLYLTGSERAAFRTAAEGHPVRSVPIAGHYCIRAAVPRRPWH
jgi:hypothetical protein